MGLSSDGASFMKARNCAECVKDGGSKGSGSGIWKCNTGGVTVTAELLLPEEHPCDEARVCCDFSEGSTECSDGSDSTASLLISRTSLASTARAAASKSLFDAGVVVGLTRRNAFLSARRLQTSLHHLRKRLLARTRIANAINIPVEVKVAAYGIGTCNRSPVTFWNLGFALSVEDFPPTERRSELKGL